MNKTQFGFHYVFEYLDADGKLFDRDEFTNLIPVEGLNSILSTTFKSAAQVATWYLFLYEGNYTPTGTETAATMPGLATECTAYTESTRRPIVFGSVLGGLVDNTASVATFTINAAKTIYGGGVSSVASKGATTGVLMSMARNTTPKVYDATGGSLLVTASFVATSS